MKLNIQMFSVTNFQPTYWSKKVQQSLDKITSLKDHCDFEFEGEIQKGKELKILGVTKPTIGDYTAYGDISIEVPTDNSSILAVNQLKFFGFYVDDVDKAQSTGLKDALLGESTKELSYTADTYVASVIDSAKANIAQIKLDISEATDGGVSVIESAFEKLYVNNVLPNSEMWLEITPQFYTKLRPKIIELNTQNPELIKKGVLGRYGNAYITIENSLTTGTIDGQANCKECLLRTSKAVAFAGQINKVEATRKEKGFTDIVKGLYTFGATVVRPEQICIIGVY